MRPFFVARLSDLRPGDFVLIECACGRIWLATKTLLTAGGLPANFPIRQLPQRLLSPNCRQRGRAVASIKWAEASVNRP
jgi:hypothetical protein